jgi:hypothetical protein
MDELRAKNQSFKNKFSKYIDEDKNGDVFTAINVLGHFFTKVYQTLKEGMNKKVERIINE